MSTEPQELTEAEWLHDLRTTKAKQAKEFCEMGEADTAVSVVHA